MYTFIVLLYHVPIHQTNFMLNTINLMSHALLNHNVVKALLSHLTLNLKYDFGNSLILVIQKKKTLIYYYRYLL